jgi:hypothetical protein
MKLYAWTADEGGVAYGRTIPDVPYIEVDSLPEEPQEQWSIDGNSIIVDTAKRIDALRIQRRQEILDHSIALISARVPALDDMKMIQLMAELWPHLNSPGANPDLAYCRDVYLFGKNRISQVDGANLQTLEGYDVASDNWPAS